MTRGRRLLLLPSVVIVATILAAAIAASPRPTAVVTIATASGETLAFDPVELTVAGSGPIAIVFRNVSSVDHNLTFTGALNGATRTIVPPGSGERIVVQPAGPGSYHFVCTIHDGMTGLLTVLPSTGR